MSKTSASKTVAGFAAILAIGAAPALAQDAAAPVTTPPAATPPAAAAPADATQPPATETPTDPAAAAPTDPAAVAQVAPPEPPPVLPTTGDGAVITSLLTKVCAPLSQGGDFVKLAKSAGLKKNNKTQEWVMPLAQKPYEVAMTPPGAANKGLCDMRVRYAAGTDQVLIESLNIWRFLHEPQLHLKRSDIINSTDAQRTTTTWDNWENQAIDGKMVGLILVQLNKDGGGPVSPAYDEAIVQYAVRPPLPIQAPVAQTPAAAPVPAPAG
jgi:hypothetical protein